ncbi:nucleoside-diphosphate sugar epimerase [Paramagnetospirillum marisnigri]|uniref:Nucleoside-diphosphate sugar epimerase n=1 Tax=Paramagnetospirillum marisnigri TaxID=1285242 RepID=A0A178MSY9_9PROT|nr:NAD-dependent epimerase/dehydratase family protein [Paramagnetospirillum marisnigri]OAN52762.1 nucleoside-diphosphate sugar epimerase [Paramagnetospirillum marisnigri]
MYDFETSLSPEHFSDRRILLVGGAGFIGHNLALCLKRLGADVHVLDSLQVNNLGAFTNTIRRDPNARLYLDLINTRLEMLRSADIPLHVVDARDYSMLSRAITEVEPHAVVHLAAVAHANRANKDPFSTFDHSMRTLENALDACRSHIEHFVYFSSSMVYGNFEGESVTEDSPCNPIGIYGALKFGGEKLVIAYNQVFGFNYTIVRPSALYGERCVSRRVGQAFIENALAGRDLTINGDGEDKLDFTYIGDLVQGIVRVLLNPPAYRQTFNLTYGGAHSINSLAAIVKEHFPGITVRHQPRDSLMPERGTLNVDKARRLIGYDPCYPVDKGYRRYLDWYLGYSAAKPDLFKP